MFILIPVDACLHRLRSDFLSIFQGLVAAADQFDRNDIGYDLAVDTEGRILVADPVRMQVRVFERL